MFHSEIAGGGSRLPLLLSLLRIPPLEPLFLHICVHFYPQSNSRGMLFPQRNASAGCDWKPLTCSREPPWGHCRWLHQSLTKSVYGPESRTYEPHEGQVKHCCHPHHVKSHSLPKVQNNTHNKMPNYTQTLAVSESLLHRTVPPAFIVQILSRLYTVYSYNTLNM